MNASIIAVGSEMLGPTRVDTNSLKITALLELFGIPLVRKCVVSDSLKDLADEIRFSLLHADLVVMTGGLGPTEDDLTREALVEALGLPVEVEQSIIEKLEQRFAARGWKMPEVNKKQANVFSGQTTLNNERGTAPGFHIQLDARHIWVFPGVPSELEWMLKTYMEPWLEQVSGGRSRHRRVLKVVGLGESLVEEKLKPYYEAHKGEPLTILASPGAVELHLIFDSKDEIARRERELLDIFGTRIFGFDDETLESAIGKLLVERGETVSVAESCTGGLVSQRITDVAGSSAYFMSGVVCYTADAKITLAGVDAQVIQDNGEVSEPVAIALARGIRKRFGTTYGVGVTGIAGPGGGSEAKPVGTVHIAVANAERYEHRKFFWPGTRGHVRWFSSQSALDLLRRFILGG